MWMAKTRSPFAGWALHHKKCRDLLAAHQMVFAHTQHPSPCRPVSSVSQRASGCSHPCRVCRIWALGWSSTPTPISAFISPSPRRCPRVRWVSSSISWSSWKRFQALRHVGQAKHSSWEELCDTGKVPVVSARIFFFAYRAELKARQRIKTKN